jgi:hypothetical protein
MQQDETRDVPETRSAALDAAALLMPAAVLAQPIVAEWAKDHFSQNDQQQPPPPEPTQDDS